MQSIKTSKGNVIEFYSNPHQMPFERFWAFQKFMIMESGIGSDIQKVGQHFSKLYKFIGSKMYDEAGKEAENLYFNFFSTLNEIDYECRALACLVSKIDEKEINDITDEGIENTLELLKGKNLTKEQIINLLEDIKKKIL